MELTEQMQGKSQYEPSEPPPEAIAVPETPIPALRIRLSLEMMIYLALIVFSVVIRLPALNVIPLSDSEAHEALAAYRAVEPRAAGSALVARNPLMFSVDALVISFAGAETTTARLPTVLVGVAVIGLALLFRRWVGNTNALLMVGLLAVSPVLLTASRTMGGAVWSAALAVGGVYLIGRFIETKRAAYALAATSVLLMLILMAEPAGFLMFLGLAIGLLFALLTLDDADRFYRNVTVDTLRQWPWIRAIVFGAIAVGAVGTIFLLYPRGLGIVGTAIGTALQGFTTRPGNTPAAYPLVVSLIYEPVLWVFGLAGAYLTFRDEVSSPAQRFIHRGLIGWLLASVVWTVIYPGAGPDHALWFTLPLIGLSAVAIERALMPVYDRFWNVPIWGPWLHSLAVVAMLAIAGINLLTVGRTFPGPNLVTLFFSAQNVVPELQIVALAIFLTAISFVLLGSVWGPRTAWYAVGAGAVIVIILVVRLLIQQVQWNALPQLGSRQWVNLILILLSIALVVITFFLVGSIWGSRAAWHGMALGVLAFLAIYGLSNGWRSAVTSATDARDLWRLHPPSDQLAALETTLQKVSQHSMGMANTLDVVVQTAQDGGDDTPLAWALRKFFKTKFVTDISPTTLASAVIAFQTDKPPKFGTGYVGQGFPASSLWDRSSLTIWDIVPWLYDRQTRIEPQPDQTMILWLRGDVYGIDSSSTPASSQ